MERTATMNDSVIPISHQVPFMFPTGSAGLVAPQSNYQVPSYMQLVSAAGPLCTQLLSHSAFGATAVQAQHSDLAMAAANTPMACKSGIMVTLENAELWYQFNALGTEMVITKSGRRMFPCLGVKVSGLEPNAQYTLAVKVFPVDNYRHKYINNRWIAVGKVDKAPPPSREHTHPDSPKLGSFWCKQPVSFKRLKLTNNRKGHANHIILDSLHKYVPQFYITKMLDTGKRGETESFQFKETSFYAVTAYQNDQVTQLKIDTNPFAKAFRDMPPPDDRDMSWRAHNYQKWSGSDYYPGNNTVSPGYRPLQPDLRPTEVVPQVPEMIPQLTEWVQPSTAEVPQSTETVPQPPEMVHQPPEMVPQLPEMIPQPTEMFPQPTEMFLAHNFEASCISPYSPPPHASPYSPMSPYTPQGLTYPQQRFFAAPEFEDPNPWGRYHQHIQQNSYSAPYYSHHQQDQVFYPPQPLTHYQPLGHFRLGSSGSEGLSPSPTRLVAHSLMHDLSYMPRTPYPYQGPRHDPFTGSEMMSGYEGYSPGKAPPVQSLPPCQYTSDPSLIPMTDSCLSPNPTTAPGMATYGPPPPVGLIQHPPYLGGPPHQSEENKAELTPVLEELPAIDPDDDVLGNWSL